MKSVLRSAKPYWIYQILIGRKKVEVGKDFPTSRDWNKTVEMYCSSDMQSFNRIPRADREWMRKYLSKIACRFVCDEMTKARADTLLQAYAHNNPEETCMSDYELYEYAEGKPLRFWHISDLRIYDKPKELWEFKIKKKCKHAPYFGICSVSCGIAENGDCDGREYTSNLTRAPQSWCYVEELSDGTNY